MRSGKTLTAAILLQNMLSKLSLQEVGTAYLSKPKNNRNVFAPVLYAIPVVMTLLCAACHQPNCSSDTVFPRVCKARSPVRHYIGFR